MVKNLTVVVAGGIAEIIASTMSKTLKELLAEKGLVGNYTASINGDAKSLDEALSDYAFVSFAEVIKGGL